MNKPGGWLGPQLVIVDQYRLMCCRMLARGDTACPGRGRPALWELLVLSNQLSYKSENILKILKLIN